MVSATSSRRQVLAYSTILVISSMAVFSACPASRGISRSFKTVSSRQTDTTLVWVSTMRTKALCFPAYMVI